MSFEKLNRTDVHGYIDDFPRHTYYRSNYLPNSIYVKFKEFLGLRLAPQPLKSRRFQPISLIGLPFHP